MSVLNLVITCISISLVTAQEACVWYEWLADEWADGITQNFTGVDGYLDADDFAEGGEFEGEDWVERFYKDADFYRPLGFRIATLGVLNDPTICLRAFDVAGYKVELMVYSMVSDYSLAVKDMSVDQYDMSSSSALDGANLQYLYECFNAPSNAASLEVAIYCDSGCFELSVDVLWRFRRSGSTYFEDDKNPEMWCSTIASNIEWPNDIDAEIPNHYTPANDNLSGATHVYSLSIATSIALAAISILILR